MSWTAKLAAAAAAAAADPAAMNEHKAHAAAGA